MKRLLQSLLCALLSVTAFGHGGHKHDAADNTNRASSATNVTPPPSATGLAVALKLPPDTATQLAMLLADYQRQRSALLANFNRDSSADRQRDVWLLQKMHNYHRQRVLALLTPEQASAYFTYIGHEWSATIPAPPP